MTAPMHRDVALLQKGMGELSEDCQKFGEANRPWSFLAALSYAFAAASWFLK